MTTQTTAAKRTALYEEHVRSGARLIPFGGFDMPVQYAGILKEHEAVRHCAGLFDLSHMGQFILEGENVASWADELTINHVATMKPWQARYNVFTNERGGAHDDVIFYKLPDRWLLVVNAGNAAKMWAHLNANTGGSGVKLSSLHGRNALIAIQGPKSVEMLDPHVDIDLNALRYYFCAEASVYGKRAIIARTGYTGEDGFELFVDGADAPEIWRALLRDNQGGGLIPAGLGARDVLRLEAGMPLYGHELTEEITPLQAGLNWAVKLGKPSFKGKSALEDQQSQDVYPRIVGLVMDGRAPATRRVSRLHGRAPRRRNPQRFRRTVRAEQEHRDRAGRERCRRSRHAARRTHPRHRIWSNRRPASVLQEELALAQPADLLYSKEHEWVKVEGDTATIGITDYAQNSLGDIVYVELPKIGASVAQFSGVGVVESVKAVSDLFTPIGGEVVEVNGGLENDPALVNREPFAGGWMFKLKLSDPSQTSGLLSSSDYEKLVAE